jgi:hypothetical protein
MQRALLVLIYITSIHTTTSGEFNYDHLSTLRFPSALTLYIEQNSLSPTNFNLLAEPQNDFEFGLSYSKIILDPSKEIAGKNIASFGDMVFVYWKPEEKLALTEVEITGGNCASPMIFASKTVPVFRLNRDLGKLQFDDMENDFVDLYGSSKHIATPKYTTPDLGSKYFYLNVLCLYYTKVRKFETMVLIVRKMTGIG